MKKTHNETIPTSGHKDILNKPKFVLTAVIGAICAIGGALAGFYMQAGHILLLIHLGEITTVSGITIGALLFSYRSTAFKPWLVPFGVGVPEEEVIVKKYIKICESTSSILVIAAFFSFVTGLINMMEYLNDTELLGKMFSAALTSFALSLGAMMAFVLPTKWKLESLLTDRQVFEAEER